MLPAGEARGRDLSVLAAPRDDALSRAVIRDIQAVARGARMRAAIRANESIESSHAPPALPPARDDGIFASASMTRLLACARAVSRASDEPVLLVGETGTGKEVLARLIHKHSRRADKEFTAFNCSEVPAGMAESVLFGHRSGAYTGATQD